MKPRLVKPSRQQSQQQPQPKKYGPDREFLQGLVDSGERVRINLLDGSVIDGVMEWADQYTIGVRGSMNDAFGGDNAAEFFWTPKHSIQFIRKGGNANE